MSWQKITILRKLALWNNIEIKTVNDLNIFANSIIAIEYLKRDKATIKGENNE